MALALLAIVFGSYWVALPFFARRHGVPVRWWLFSQYVLNMWSELPSTIHAWRKGEARRAEILALAVHVSSVGVLAVWIVTGAAVFFATR